MKQPLLTILLAVATIGFANAQNRPVIERSTTDTTRRAPGAQR